MHTLIVVAHHDPRSLTHSVASQIAQSIDTAATGHTYELADLAQERFDPRFTASDHAVHRKEAAPPADVIAEQARVDRADAVVLVFPVYWWSMPALMKGWIDRVFSNGWAFDFGLESTLVKKLGHLDIHLVGIGGADAATYTRHGYTEAMRTQIDHGIFNYCGANVASSQLLLDSETDGADRALQAARELGQKLFTAT
jgi:NAD(P)H dehydrogenase (quinone)